MADNHKTVTKKKWQRLQQDKKTHPPPVEGFGCLDAPALYTRTINKCGRQFKILLSFFEYIYFPSYMKDISRPSSKIFSYVLLTDLEASKSQIICLLTLFFSLK